MKPALHSRQTNLVHRPLLPAFDQCEELHAASFADLEMACEHLDQEAGRSGRARFSSFEAAIARHLSDNPSEVAQLRESTRCELTAHLISEPRELKPLCDCSRFDTAFEAATRDNASTPGPNWLLAVARTAVGRSDLTFRSLEARTAPDSRNCSVVYPDAKHSLPRVQAICNRLASLSATSAMATVVWCMTAFLNAHPLPDGNGRVARLLFALGAHRAGLISGPWLALGPLVYASNGAFEIAVRRAEIQSRWQPLIDLVTIYTRFLASRCASCN